MSSSTGKWSLNRDLKNALIISRVAALLGNSHNSCEIDGWRAQGGEDSMMGILKSARVTVWAVLVETHLRPASEDIGIPLKYQLGPH